jgi:hypothetical protein
MAKADLFSNTALTKEERESLLKFGFLNPLKQGEHVSLYMKREQIHQYIDQYINIKYQDKFKQIIDRACALTIIGFGSYNLLISRRTFDKNKHYLATAFDPLNTIATEKGNIIKLIEEISKLKPSTTHSGDITRYQKEIAADIDQMRNTFEGIELNLIKIDSKHKQQQLDILVPALLKNKSPFKITEQETKNIDLQTMVRSTKSPEQLLKEIDELENRQAHVLAQISVQKNSLEVRALSAEKKFQDLDNRYADDMHKEAKIQLELESKNQLLQENLNTAQATIEKQRHELNNIRITQNKTPWWHYGLACLGFAVGTALCASGMGALAGAPIVGICSLILGGAIILGDSCYVGYSIYHHCKSKSDSDDPTSPAPTMRITTNLTQTIPLPNPPELSPSHTPAQSEEQTFISTKPMFSPKLRRVTDKDGNKEKISPKISF